MNILQKKRIVLYILLQIKKLVYLCENTIRNMKRYLIIIDAQNDFIDGALGTKEAQQAVPEILHQIQNWNWDNIIVTQDTHHADYLETREGKLLPVPHCIEGTEGWLVKSDILRSIYNKIKCIKFIHKETFGSLELPAYLQEHEGIETHEKDVEFHFMGFCTDICVVSNVLILKAVFPEADFFVHADCCAGVTPEKHQHALDTMASCQVQII